MTRFLVMSSSGAFGWRSCHDLGTRFSGGWVGDTLVSSCTLTIVPNLTCGCMPYCIIKNLVTHAAHINKGHGKAILARAGPRLGCWVL
jgi:hypothetical protein